MDWDEVFKVILAALASIGGGGVIVFALSSWFGKVWAKKILANEAHELNTKLEATKTQLEVIKNKTLRFQNDKILTYRLVVDVVSKLLADFDATELGSLSTEEADKSFHIFNQNRIQVYGYLAMLAPQTVMDAQDELMDYLLQIAEDTAHYEWKKVRELALRLLNEIRIDIGIDSHPISYNGVL